MAEQNYNIPALYHHTYGIRGRLFVPPKPYKTATGDTVKPNDYTDYTGEGLSLLGTPFFMRTSLDGERLPNEPLIDIAGGKKIVTTEIDGSEGTFKELYSIDDYKITIRGLCIQDDGSNEYPQEQVRNLSELYAQNRELKITNAFANMLGIAYIVIVSIDFPKLEGVTGMQPYVISALSDKRIQLTIKDLNKNG